MIDLLLDWLGGRGMEGAAGRWTAHAIAIAAIIILCWIADLIAKRLILKGVTRLVKHSANKWDDTFLERQVFDRLSHLAPAFVILILVPLAFPDAPRFTSLVERLAIGYMLLAGVLVLNNGLDAVLDIYRRYDVSRSKPIKSYVQIAKLILFLTLAIIALSVLMNRSPLVLLSGVGALTAVLLLIFKDTILGLVASIQLSGNDMVRRGDWISMPKFGADGDVMDVSLTTVKVRNWDKTVSTIPTYALITNAFRNWRGMEESGGRRIKRSLNIDLNSIRFCDDQMIERLRKIRLISEYVDRKLGEVSEHNKKLNLDDSARANGRRLTNIGTFRSYVEAYLGDNPHIHKEMTFMVRQLAPTEHGLPLEIYVFSRDQAWVKYEAIQADIFDHIFAVIPEFGLRLYQAPSGSDFNALVESRTADR